MGEVLALLLGVIGVKPALRATQARKALYQ